MPNDLETLSKLLHDAHFINENDLDEAVQLAKNLDIPLERALSMLKLISENKIRSATDAKERINSGEVTLENATKILQQSDQLDIPFNEAWQRAKAQTATTAINHPLGELAISTKLLTREQIAHSLERSRTTGIPLGKLLIVSRYITNWLLGEILTTLRLVKEKAITSEQASHYLHNAVQHKLSVTQLLFEAGIYQGAHGDTLTLLELLAMADCLTEADMQEIEELHLVDSRPYLQILNERNSLPASILEAAGTLLEMCGNYLKPFQAAEALKQIKLKEIPVYQAIAELKPPPQVPQPVLRLGDLLVESGITSRNAIEEVLSQQQSNTTVRIGKQLLSANLISETDLYNALRCQSLMHEGILSAKQAIDVLTSAYHEKIKLEEAFAQHTLYAPSRMQWSWR